MFTCFANENTSQLEKCRRRYPNTKGSLNIAFVSQKYIHNLYVFVNDNKQIKDE